jgi:hypothetical protein
MHLEISETLQIQQQNDIWKIWESPSLATVSTDIPSIDPRLYITVSLYMHSVNSKGSGKAAWYNNNCYNSQQATLSAKFNEAI